jgi:hypothetical protein
MTFKLVYTEGGKYVADHKVLSTAQTQIEFFKRGFSTQFRTGQFILIDMIIAYALVDPDFDVTLLDVRYMGKSYPVKEDGRCEFLCEAKGSPKHKLLDAQMKFMRDQIEYRKKWRWSRSDRTD